MILDHYIHPQQRGGMSIMPPNLYWKDAMVQNTPSLPTQALTVAKDLGILQFIPLAKT